VFPLTILSRITHANSFRTISPWTPVSGLEIASLVTGFVTDAAPSMTGRNGQSYLKFPFHSLPMNLKMPVLITNRLRILRFMGAMREINQGGLILARHMKGGR
jgi:hypothetical protein